MYSQGAKTLMQKKKHLEKTSVMRDNTDWSVCLYECSPASNDQELSKKFVKWDLFQFIANYMQPKHMDDLYTHNNEPV